jgi:broad specificity phosphatase PhoE
MISLMKTRVHVLRHGEVENPNKVLYGRQPNWHLSTRGVQMAEAVALWSKDRPIRAIHVSPLERAQETAAPIVATHGISITTDPRLIEAANIFEGKPFSVGDGVLRRPSTWRYLWNPWRPSWGEPYKEQIKRMISAINFARDSAIGAEAICVSHQLPIWIVRSHVEGKSLIHDPRKRECSLASITTFVFNSDGVIEDVEYCEPARHLLPPKQK